MNGFAFKSAAVTVALLSTVFLSSLVFAVRGNDLDKTSIFSSKLGCMSCHQSEVIQPEKASESKHKKHTIHAN